MNYLLDVTERYRTESEAEAQELINEAKKNSGLYELKKYSSSKKERKQKGEVIEEFYVVSLTKVFNSEKEPEEEISIEYSQGGAF